MLKVPLNIQNWILWRKKTDRRFFGNCDEMWWERQISEIMARKKRETEGKKRTQIEIIVKRRNGSCSRIHACVDTVNPAKENTRRKQMCVCVCPCVFVHKLTPMMIKVGNYASFYWWISLIANDVKTIFSLLMLPGKKRCSVGLVQAICKTTITDNFVHSIWN